MTCIGTAAVMALDMVPGDLVQGWEVVYREYMSASGRVQMSRSSAKVAAAWREMAATPSLEWWVVAALTTAAEAFEEQARDWGGAMREVSRRPADRDSGRAHAGPVALWSHPPAHHHGQQRPED